MCAVIERCIFYQQAFNNRYDLAFVETKLLLAVNPTSGGIVLLGIIAKSPCNKQSFINKIPRSTHSHTHTLTHVLTHTHTHTLISSQTMSENSDMQREIPRLHAVLASKSKRIGELEHMLRETKEAANQEYDRLRAENERLTESFTAKLKEKERECERNMKLKFKLESTKIYIYGHITACMLPPPPPPIQMMIFSR